MAHSRRASGDEPSIFSDPTKQLEAFGRKVTATASHLIGDGASSHYQAALGEIHRELRRPIMQQRIFSLSQASPREYVRSKISTSEIQHRALTYLPDELLSNIPESDNPFSLYQGFEASLPDVPGKSHDRHASRGRRLLGQSHPDGPPATAQIAELRNDKDRVGHRLEMMTIRKNMCSTEIREIDDKIANLNTMRKIVLDRLAQLEQEEVQLEEDFITAETRLEEAEEEAEDLAALSGTKTPTQTTEGTTQSPESPSMEASFMSESIYQKLPSPRSKRGRPTRRKSNFILHEHLQAGSMIREIQAHSEMITALDFDAPFGTLVTAALDDTVRVWDLNAGRCMGLLEGHLSSVRCLQVEDNIVATGSMDASVRLWDLSQADYTPPPANRINKSDAEAEEDDAFEDAEEDAIPFEMPDTTSTSSRIPTPPPSSMVDCPLFTLSAHVAQITALHFHNSTLVSGSADKTLRQWDLEKGRCVQTLDVLWAAAQASSTVNASATTPGAVDMPQWRSTNRAADSSADFVGALQCFDAALACGTADGLVRLWDLRSGQVHRSLVGHTGPVTCLQFDDVYMVTGSMDRSIRIWDLRTGSLFDAFAYVNPVTDMSFDTRRIAAACGEPVIKVYDKTDGNQWDCGPEAAVLAASGQYSAASRGRAASLAIMERVRLKEGYMVEGRKDGVVGVWSC